MGRPWWYDSYWEKDKPPKRRRFPLRRRAWVWVGLAALSLFLAAARVKFRLLPAAWITGFVSQISDILTIAIFVRAILSWFRLGRYRLPLLVLDDLTEPVLAPLRRVIPTIGRIDISPLVAIVVLRLIPGIFSRLV